MNGTNRKWTDKQTACVALIREIVGEAIPIRAVDYDMCLHVRTTLARVPTNRLKFYGEHATIEIEFQRCADDTEAYV